MLSPIPLNGMSERRTPLLRGEFAFVRGHPRTKVRKSSRSFASSPQKRAGMKPNYFFGTKNHEITFDFARTHPNASEPGANKTRVRFRSPPGGGARSHLGNERPMLRSRAAVGVVFARPAIFSAFRLAAGFAFRCPDDRPRQARKSAKNSTSGLTPCQPTSDVAQQRQNRPFSGPMAEGLSAQLS